MKRKKKTHKEEALVAVEGNFMETPFFVTNDKSPSSKDIFTIWITKDRGITITPPPLGAPDSFDATIFLYLLWKATREFQKTGIFPKKISFTISEIGKALGTRNWERIKIAIERLTTTTYRFIQSFRRGGIYIDNTVRIFDKSSYWTREGDLSQKKARETTYVVFSDDIVNSITSGYYKYLDFQKHRKLKRPLARRLHFLLAKRLGENREIQIGFKKLAYAIPLKTYTEHQKKKIALSYLIPAFEELKNVGILDYYYDKEKDIFHITQPSAKREEMDFQNRIRLYLTNELRGLWFKNKQIEELLNNKDWDLIAGALEYIEHIGKENLQYPSAFFLRTIEDGEVPDMLLKRSKERVNSLIRELIRENKRWKGIIKSFKEEFEKKYPLKDGFLKYRLMREELIKLKEEGIPQEDSELNVEQIIENLMGLGYSREKAEEFVKNIKQ